MKIKYCLKTLDIIKEIENVNWIIKPHPAEFKYGSKTKTHSYLKNIKRKNIAIESIIFFIYLMIWTQF